MRALRGLGCRVGAKQSGVKTWLADAHANGARLVIRSRVQRVLVEGGAARGIIGVTAQGRRLTIRSRAVVAACGAIHTPALLKRSGLQNPNIGKHPSCIRRASCSACSTRRSSRGRA
jgi:long-chain-alcohol oxidase